MSQLITVTTLPPARLPKADPHSGEVAWALDYCKIVNRVIHYRKIRCALVLSKLNISSPRWTPGSFTGGNCPQCVTVGGDDSVAAAGSPAWGLSFQSASIGHGSDAGRRAFCAACAQRHGGGERGRQFTPDRRH